MLNGHDLKERMKDRMKLTSTLAAAALAAPFGTAALAETAGGICAVEQIIACEAFDACQRGLPSSAQLPTLIRIDLANETVVSLSAGGGDRSSAISLFEEVEDGYLITGVDDGNGWHMRISGETGRFTLVSAHESVGFIGFGVCTKD